MTADSRRWPWRAGASARQRIRDAVEATARPVRVTMLSSLPPTKGVSPYTAALVDSLSEIPEIDLEVLSFRSIYPAWLYPGGEPNQSGGIRQFPGARIRRVLNWYNPLGWVWAGLTLRGDVVHAQWWSYVLAPIYATVLGVARLRGKRVLLTVHNVEPHEKSRLRRFLNAFVLRFAHACVVHSEANRDSLRPRLGAGARVEVIPHGVLYAARSGLDQGGARARLGIPADAGPIVLTFGNIREYKGVDVLLEAFAHAAEETPGAMLIIAGKPWIDWQPYDDIIDRLGLRDRVCLHLDFVADEDIEAYFKASDVVVLPYTHFDGQSGVASLALPFGKPLIVTSVGGLPELVTSDGCIVAPGSVAELAGALRRVLGDTDLRRRLGLESQELGRALEWGPIAARTLDVYRASGVRTR